MQPTYRQLWQHQSKKFRTAFLLLAAGLFTACIKPPPPPPPPAEIDCQQVSEAGWKKRNSKDDLRYSDPDVYIKDEVLLTGAKESVQNIADSFGLKLAGEGKDSEPIVVSDNKVIAHYAITNAQLVEYIVCEINKKSSESGVAADPNYVFSPGQWSGMGGPWSEGGSWEGIPGGGLGEAPAADFPRQWALGSNGINLIDENDNRLTSSTGDGVRVGIFDTSPFQSEEEVDSVEMSLTLRTEFVPDPTFGCNEHSVDIRNHGLFVTSLLHAIAPASQLQLFPVLNACGYGNMFNIAQAINQFIDETEQGLPTVINLSLGAHHPETPEDFGLPGEIRTLEDLMLKAQAKGIVVVAAAGNDSYDNQAPNYMQLPADYDSVIGVAASAADQVRGCFSNMGDVAAPGGNGEGAKNNSCTIPTDCGKQPELCLIGRSLNSQTGYAYWAGTSFATPLVSGMAALQLSQGIPSVQAFERLSKKEGDGGCAVTRAALAPDPALGAGITRMGGVCQ